MICVGYSKIKNYLLWVTPANLNDNNLNPNCIDKEYYFVLCLKQERGYNFYTDLKSYLGLDARNYPGPTTNSKEFEFYSANKSQPYPLTKLSKEKVETLFNDMISKEDWNG